MIDLKINYRKILESFLLVNLLILLLLPRPAQAKDHPMFAGGMFFTMAPLQMAPPLDDFLAMGVGGRLYFYLGQHVRLGGMGSVLKRTVGELEHTWQQGGGGAFVHYCYRWSFFELSAGLMVGGQVLRWEEVAGVNGDLWQVRRQKQGHWLLTPQLDLTFWVSKKLQLLLMAEYRHPYFTNNIMGHTVQFYLGIHFSH